MRGGGARLRRGGDPARGDGLRALPRPLSRARRRPWRVTAMTPRRECHPTLPPCRRDAAFPRASRRGSDRYRAARARPRHRARKDAHAVRQADRRLSGRLASTRADLRGRRARPLARLLGGVVRRRGRRARTGRRGCREGVRGRGRRPSVRALDPGARRHGVHVGAPTAPLLQARVVARRVRSPTVRAAAGNRERAPRMKLVRAPSSPTARRMPTPPCRRRARAWSSRPARALSTPPERRSHRETWRLRRNT